MYQWFSMDEVTWSYIVTVLAVTPLVLLTFKIILHVIAFAYAYCKMCKHLDVSSLVVEDWPPVSIIKPLMGVDPYLEVNLESHFTLDYPKFEILLCVQDDQDPAINLVNKLRQRYPNVDSTLLIGGMNGIVNPMVNNMTPAYNAAKYNTLWISTSRILASTEILKDMTSFIVNPKIGLVHQVPFTTDQSGVAAAVEKIYFANTSRYFLAFHCLGVSCFTGMSYLVRKSDLEEFNGLSFFGKFLAEDFFIAKFLHEKGYYHQVSRIAAQQNVASCSVPAYKDRMVRWLRLRLNMLPVTSGLLEPIIEVIPLSVYIGWAIFFLFGVNPYLAGSIHAIFWCIQDFLQLRCVQKSPLPFYLPTYFIAWIIRELLVVLVYFEAVFNVRHIKWGKRTYRLSSFGESIEVVNSNQAALPI